MSELESGQYKTEFTLENDESTKIMITQHQEETKRHGKLNTIRTFLLFITAIIAFIIYAQHGINKMNESKNNPQTKSNIIPVENYDVPLTLFCNVSPFALIFPVRVVRRDYPQTDETICYTTPANVFYGYYNESIQSNDSKFSNDSNPCDKFAISDYSQKLDRTTWTIFNFSSKFYNASQCWAIIPPKNAQFNLQLYIEYIFLPGYQSDLSYFYEKVTNFNILSALVVDSGDVFGVRYNSIHPDGIDQWYSALQQNYGINDEVKTAGYPWFSGSVWVESAIVLSLYTTQSVSNDVSHMYDTRFNYGVYKALHLTTNIPNGTCIHGTGLCGYNLPRIAFAFEVNIMSFSDNKPNLYQSYTTEYIDYTLTDFISGIGGFLSSVAAVTGFIFGILFTGIPFLKWNGIAPFPPFDSHFKERLNRFLDSKRK